jgi:predicted O-methyltransferase YrrM
MAGVARKEMSEAAAFKSDRQQDIVLLQGNNVVLLEVNGHNRYDHVFIDHAKLQVVVSPIDVQFIDVKNFSPTMTIPSWTIT